MSISWRGSCLFFSKFVVRCNIFTFLTFEWISSFDLIKIFLLSSFNLSNCTGSSFSTVMGIWFLWTKICMFSLSSFQYYLVCTIFQIWMWKSELNTNIKKLGIVCFQNYLFSLELCVYNTLVFQSQTNTGDIT